MVHLLGDRAHHAGRLHGHSVVHGWRDHCTLVETEKKWPVCNLGTEEFIVPASCIHWINISFSTLSRDYEKRSRNHKIRCLKIFYSVNGMSFLMKPICGR